MIAYMRDIHPLWMKVLCACTGLAITFGSRTISRQVISIRTIGEVATKHASGSKLSTKMPCQRWHAGDLYDATLYTDGAGLGPRQQQFIKLLYSPRRILF